MCRPSEAIDANGRRKRRPRSDPPSSPHRPFSIPILILIMTIGSSSSKTGATTSTYDPPSSSKTGATTSHQPPSSSSSSPPSATSSPACAACKYQRRKCKPDCTLAPYFPANQPHQFLNTHRLFGVSKILKIVRHLDPRHRPDAMRSIIFQSNARAHDPVGGCYRIIRDLERQLQRDHVELAFVRRQLAIYRAQASANLCASASYDSHFVQPEQQFLDFCCYGGSDHHDYGCADHMFMSITDSFKNGKNYVDGGIMEQKCVTEEKDVKSVVDMFDVSRDVDADGCTSWIGHRSLVAPLDLSNLKDLNLNLSSSTKMSQRETQT